MKLKWDTLCQYLNAVLGTREALIKLLLIFIKWDQPYLPQGLLWKSGKITTQMPRPESGSCRCPIKVSFLSFSSHFHLSQCDVSSWKPQLSPFPQMFLRTIHCLLFQLFVFQPLESNHCGTDAIMAVCLPHHDFIQFFIYISLCYSHCCMFLVIILVLSDSELFYLWVTSMLFSLAQCLRWGKQFFNFSCLFHHPIMYVHLQL